MGAIILSNELIDEAVVNLKPGDFYLPSHRRIFMAMIALYEVGMEIDPILIAEELRRDNSLESAGGILFLTNLTNGLPHVTSIKNFIKIVKGKALLRETIKAAYKIAAEAIEEEDEPAAIVSRAEQAIFDLRSSDNGSSVLNVKQISERARTILEGYLGGTDSALPSPWTALNNLCRGGIHESELWGIASLIKSGKSAAVKQWAHQLVLSGQRVLIFTREMSEVKYLFRMLSPMTDIPTSQIRYGLDANRINDLIRASRQIEQAAPGLFIDPKTSLADEFKARIREMIRLEGIEIVFADYLQLFKSGKKSDSRATEIGYVWRTMKEVAQDFNTRVVAVAQFNREAFKVSDRPMFHQIEGSGEGEKAVDVGIVLWTELAKGEPNMRPATMFIDYQREEDAGTRCELTFHGRTMEFSELAVPERSHDERY